LLVAAASWFLLKELAPLLRPLLLAVFLAYVMLPVGLYVKGHVRGGARHLALLAGLTIVLAGVAVLTYGDIVDLAHELPQLRERSREIITQATDYTRQHMPHLADAIEGTARAGERGTSRLQDAFNGLADATAGALIEALEVVFYLLLILFEAGRLPGRMRQAFAGEQAEQVFTLVGSINAAIASYLKAKVKANFVLSLPVMLVLWVCGIKFVLLWGVLTFFANFVPYLGSIVACALPILYGFIDRGFTWQPIVVAVLLPAVHTISAYVIEPNMTGKAVDLSPLVVLIALAFWGLCWGLIGMVLAVPLTAMLKIALENAPGTRPIARLMGGD
jgi:AI-2 transport protein TqsA